MKKLIFLGMFSSFILAGNYTCTIKCCDSSGKYAGNVLVTVNAPSASDAKYYLDKGYLGNKASDFCKKDGYAAYYVPWVGSAITCK